MMADRTIEVDEELDLLGEKPGSESSGERRPPSPLPAARRVRDFPLAAATITFVAIVLGAVALGNTNERDIGPLGLIQAVPFEYLLALGLLGLAFALTLTRRRLRSPLLAVQVAALATGLHALPSIVEAEPRYFSAYLHAGFIEYIGRAGATLPTLDGRFSWPGAFGLGALMSDAAGFGSATSLIRWAPMLQNLLYLAPVWAIAAAFTPSRRARWATVWLFLLGNWVGQDYLSPQGLNFLLFLVGLAVILNYFPAGAGGAPGNRVARFARWVAGEGGPQNLNPTTPVPDGVSRVLVVLLVLLAAVMSASHQLSPVFFIASVGALVVTRGTRLGYGFFAALLLVQLGWLSFGAEKFWLGHLHLITGGFGSLGSNLEQGLGGRMTGSADRATVLYLRIASAGALMGLAAIGLWRRRWSGHGRASHLALAGAPFGVLAMQAYGGEALLRVFLFALPLLAAAAAFAFFPDPAEGASRRLWVPAMALTAVSAVLTLSFLVSRYGNEEFERVSPDDRAAVEWFYNNADYGDTLLATSRNLPWRYQDIERYRYNPVDDLVFSDPERIAGLLAQADSTGYLILSTSQEVFGRQLYDLPEGWMGSLRNRLLVSGLFKPVFREGSAEVLVARRGPAR